MAKELVQATANRANEVTPERIIFYWKDEANNTEGYNIVNYDELTTEEKSVYDAFVTLIESKNV